MLKGSADEVYRGPDIPKLIGKRTTKYQYISFADSHSKDSFVNVRTFPVIYSSMS
jgi:hypothetical protein